MATDENMGSVQVDGLTVSERFTRAFAAAAGNEVRRRVRREVYGDEYPEEADPNSFVTLTDLRRIARELRVASGETFVDIGCGRGGPGMWVARETAASLVGSDP